jgi:uncharacterized protein YbjT (DUF2867 family)
MATILITGATGYIGKRLIELLSYHNHTIYCAIRDKNRFDFKTSEQLKIIEIDFLKTKDLDKIPSEIDVAFFLMHSMSSKYGNFVDLEKQVALNFVKSINKTNIKQVIYLTGMLNKAQLSQHLISRKQVENILATGNYELTTLRAGIIIGSGSASFEIIRDLVEKLPVMIAPKWINTQCQPIAIRDVLKILEGCILNPFTYNRNFDIAGPEILTYKEMLLAFSNCRKLKRSIYTIPVLTPRLSSYWLYFVTSVSYPLAKALVDSMSIQFVARDSVLINHLKVKPIKYRQSIEYAFEKIKQNSIVSSWRDTLSENRISSHLEKYIQVPTLGCFKVTKTADLTQPSATLDKIWSIGGNNGWYYADRLWQFRGWIDKLFGGVGLNRNRRSQNEIRNGDALDFWRVIVANKQKGRLLLYAEMKLPGEAWLEFKLIKNKLKQTATFRPKGILGRIYWYTLYPFHFFIFRGMLKNISK